MGWLLAAAGIASGIGQIYNFFSGQSEAAEARKRSREAEERDLQKLALGYRETAGGQIARAGRGDVEVTGLGAAPDILGGSRQTVTAGPGGPSQGREVTLYRKENVSKPTGDATTSPLIIQQAIADAYSREIVYRHQQGTAERENLEGPSELDLGLNLLATILDTSVTYYNWQNQMDKFNVPGKPYNPFDERAGLDWGMGY